MSGYYELSGFVYHEDEKGVSLGGDPEIRCTWKRQIPSGTLHLEGYAGGRVVRLGEIEAEAELIRAYLELPLKRFDLTVGKQAFHWGSAAIWNPTDIFGEVFFAQPWEFRKGHHALRLDKDLDWRTSLTFVVGFKDSKDLPNNRVWAMRLGLLSGITDLALVCGLDEDDDVWRFGIDMRGDLRETGWHLESARKERTNGSSWTETVVGLSRTHLVPHKLTSMFQYYRNTGNTDRIEEYDLGALFRGEKSSLATEYVSFSARLDLPKRRTLDLLVIKNLDDRSYRLIPAYRWRRYGSQLFSLGFVIGCGKAGEFNPTAPIDPGEYLPEKAFFMSFKRHF